jgi:hypothetical protein
MLSTELIYGQNYKTQFDPKTKGPTSSSKDKISFNMNLTIWIFQIRKLTLQGTFNQLLYHLQIVANLVLILLGEGLNPNKIAREIALHFKSKVTNKPNTTYH